MAGDTQVSEPVLASDRPAEDRLRPAEVHEVLRQKLERLITPWGLEPTDVTTLASQMRIHTYAPGETILPARARAHFMGLIVSGRVAVYSGQRTSRQQIGVLFPGNTFGDDLLGGEAENEAMLEALTSCEVWFLRRADLESLAKQRRGGQWRSLLGRLTPFSMLLLLLAIAAFLALSLPPLRQALALGPMAVGQWCSERAGGGLARQGFEQCVVRTWSLARDLAPADANPLVAIGTFYFEQGDLEAAERSFEAAKALAPNWAEIHNNLGLVYARRGEHEKAISAFQRALELEPGTSAIEHNLGLSLQILGDYDEALAHYRQAVAFGEPQVSTLVNMAIVYYETGQLAKAAGTAQQALRYDETSVPAYTVLGAVALESQQPAMALDQLRRAVALDSSYSQAHLYLGLTHKALGQPAEAISSLEQAMVTTDDEKMQLEIQRYLEELQGGEPVGGSP
jgi:tetratricopeptide (TPR) repeat protein